MEPVTVIKARACPIDANDVDTDQIIPKQYLKRVERTGFGPFAFSEWRYDEDGTPKPEFPMNKPEHAGAQHARSRPRRPRQSGTARSST
jgi:3-isopropylmalate/(R)-2-methylmalate dehydratase small subunit